MFATITLFVATTLPLGLFNILLTPVLRGPMNQIELLELSSIVTFIGTINYTLDFYIHCLTSRLFRKELMNIFKCQHRNNRIQTITNTLQVKPTGFPMTQNEI
jgi:hypothetical protein